MTGPNWGMISSGATFQAMVNCLILFEDPKAHVFSRPGPDGGQDALSGDGKTVYQAKFRQDGQFDEIIGKLVRKTTKGRKKAQSNEKKELDYISEYRSRTHRNYSLWQGITNWVLVTNCPINRKDQKRWENEVVPAFKNIGLDASLYWDRGNLDTFLTTYPHVKQAYFEGENRVFVSLPEVMEQQQRDFKEWFNVPYQGRVEVLEQAKAFLTSDKSFLAVHGPGGIGKTRTIYEVGRMAVDEGLQVFWAKTESMNKSSDWFQAIVVDKPTLLLLDIDDVMPSLVKRVIEQLDARARNWKVCVAARSSNKQTLDALEGLSLRNRKADPIVLDSLPEKDAVELVQQRLLSGPFQQEPDREILRVCKKINALCKGNPTLLNSATDHLEKHGSLSSLDMLQDQASLFDGMYEDAIQPIRLLNLSPQQIGHVLQWVALLGVLHFDLEYEDYESLDFGFVSRATGVSEDDLVMVLLELIRRRFLSRKGIRGRLWDMQSPVFREYILQQELTFPNNWGHGGRIPKKRTQNLVFQLASGHVPHKSIGRIVETLAYQEYLSQERPEKPLRFLDPLVQNLKDVLETGDRKKGDFVFDLLSSFSFARPRDAAEIIHTLRMRFGEDGDLCRRLSSKLSSEVAMYVQEPGDQRFVLEEMLEFVRLEKEGNAGKANFNNDAPSSHLQPVLWGNPNFRRDYTHVANPLAKKFLEQLADSNELPATELAVIEAFLLPLLKELRHVSYQTDRYTISTGKQILPPGGPQDTLRKEIQRELRAIIQARTAPKCHRETAWNLLTENNGRSFALPPSDQEDKNSQAHLAYTEDTEELQWILDQLKGKTLEPWELGWARRFWWWYVDTKAESNQQDHPNKTLGLQCEQLCLKHPLAKEFQPLFGNHTNWEKTRTRIAEKAKELSLCSSPDVLRDFVERLKLAPRTHDYQKDENLLRDIGRQLGSKAPANPEIGVYAVQALQGPDPLHAAFGLAIGSSWVLSLRQAKETRQANSVLDHLLNNTLSPENQVRLLTEVLGNPWVKERYKSDFNLIQEKEPTFLELGRIHDLGTILGCLSLSDWKRFTRQYLDTNGKLDEEQAGTLFSALIESLHYAWLPEEQRKPPLSSVQLDWILDQALPVLFAGNFMTDGAFYAIETITAKLGSRPLSWLAEAFQKYMEWTQSHLDSGHSTAISFYAKLADWVTPITKDNANDGAAQKAIDDLLAFNVPEFSVRNYLPKYLAKIDPEGLVVPQALAKRIKELKNPDLGDIMRWALMAGELEENSPAWRVVAVEACDKAKRLNEEERSEVYRSLLPMMGTAWSSSPGEIAPQFITTVANTKKRRGEEADLRLMPYWEWRFNYTEGDLRHHKEFREEIEN